MYIGLLSIVMALAFMSFPLPVSAAEKTEVIKGSTYDLAEDAKYEISTGTLVDNSAERFTVSGNITNVSIKNGITSLAVDSGVLKINLDYNFAYVYEERYLRISGYV